MATQTKVRRRNTPDSRRTTSLESLLQTQSLSEPTNSSKHVAASPDATSMTGCALNKNYRAHAGNSNPR
jgi:hypothetical protein